MNPRVPLQPGDVLQSKTIQDIEIEISPEYEEVCRGWLIKQQCTLERVRAGWYRVGFPGGTLQEERFGTSGLYTRRSYIVLQSGVEMSLYVASPINATQRTRVTMGFPPEIFPD